MTPHHAVIDLSGGRRFAHPSITPPPHPITSLPPTTHRSMTAHLSHHESYRRARGGGGGGQGEGAVVAGRLLDDGPHRVVGLVLFYGDGVVMRALGGRWLASELTIGAVAGWVLRRPHARLVFGLYQDD